MKKALISLILIYLAYITIKVNFEIDLAYKRMDFLFSVLKCNHIRLEDDRMQWLEYEVGIRYDTVGPKRIKKHCNSAKKARETYLKTKERFETYFFL